MFFLLNELNGKLLNTSSRLIGHVSVQLRVLARFELFRSEKISTFRELVCWHLWVSLESFPVLQTNSEELCSRFGLKFEKNFIVISEACNIQLGLLVCAGFLRWSVCLVLISSAFLGFDDFKVPHFVCSKFFVDEHLILHYQLSSGVFLLKGNLLQNVEVFFSYPTFFLFNPGLSFVGVARE